MHLNFFITAGIALFWSLLFGAVTRRAWVGGAIAFAIVLGMHAGILALELLLAGSYAAIGWLVLVTSMTLWPHVAIVALGGFLGTRLRQRTAKAADDTSAERPAL